MSVHVVGSINVDLTYRVAHLPLPGETILAREVVRSLGGKGANQAVACVRLLGPGARVRFFGAVGDDAGGAYARERLAATGLDLTDVFTLDAPTGTAIVTIDDAGENQIIVHPGANAAFTPAWRDDAELRARAATADVLLCQLEIDLEVVTGAITHAPPSTFVALNAAPAQPLPAAVLERADLVVVNEGEYAALPELRGARQVAVTSGADGARLLREGVEVARVPGVRLHPDDVVSTVGAGDAFSAGLTLALAGGATAVSALTMASRVGAAAVASADAQPDLEPLAAYA